MPSAAISVQGEGPERPDGTRASTLPRKLQVLLLEDNALFAGAVESALEDCGDVTTVRTVKQALESLCHPWHAFVFDIALPDGCGLEALRQARAAHPEAMALAMSGSTEREDVNTAFELGAHYLAKPFSSETIVAFFEQRLPRPLPSDAGASDLLAPDAKASKTLPCRELERLVAAARASVTDVAMAEAEKNRCLALLARAVTAAEGDRTGNLEAFARAAGLSRQTLQEYVTLTTRWEPAQVVALIGFEDRFGRTLTKANLVRIARGPWSVRASFDRGIKDGDLDLGAVLAALPKHR